MANVNEAIADLLSIDGAITAAIVDSSSGMVLGKGGTGLNADIAAAGITEVVRAELKVIKMLNVKETIDDILITLGLHYHVIRPLAEKPDLFIYVVLDRAKANLAMARYRVTEIETELSI